MQIPRAKFLGDRSTYLDIQPPTAVPKVHTNLVEPQAPILKPVVPGGRLVHLLWSQPTSNAENLVTTFFFGDMENAVTHSPSTAYP